MNARGVGHLTCGMERRGHVIFRRQTQRKRAEGRIKAVDVIGDIGVAGPHDIPRLGHHILDAAAMELADGDDKAA